MISPYRIAENVTLNRIFWVVSTEYGEKVKQHFEDVNIDPQKKETFYVNVQNLSPGKDTLRYEEETSIRFFEWPDFNLLSCAFV